MKSIIGVQLCCPSVPSGPPLNFTISVTSHTLTLSWFLLSPLNVMDVSLTTTWYSGGSIINSTRTRYQSDHHRTTAIHQLHSVLWVLQQWWGDGPPATVSGTSDEDGETQWICTCSLFTITTVISLMMCCTVPAGPPRQFFRYWSKNRQLLLVGVLQSTPNGVFTEYTDTSVLVVGKCSMHCDGLTDHNHWWVDSYHTPTPVTVVAQTSVELRTWASYNALPIVIDEHSWWWLHYVVRRKEETRREWVYESVKLVEIMFWGGPLGADVYATNGILKHL